MATEAEQEGVTQQPLEAPQEDLPVAEHVKRKDFDKEIAMTPPAVESRRSKSESGLLEAKRQTPRMRRDKRTGEAMGRRPGSGGSLSGFEAKYPVRS